MEEVSLTSLRNLPSRPALRWRPRWMSGEPYQRRQYGRCVHDPINHQSSSNTAFISKPTTGRGLQRDSRHRLPTREAVLESMPGSVRCIGIAEAGAFPIAAFHDQICDWSAREHQLWLETPTIVVEG
jgi:hypothetical protein